MSTFDYNDLYLLCQDTGKYHMFLFDIINSRNMPSLKRQEAQVKMTKLMTRIYKIIEKIQESTGRQILVFDDDFVTYKSRLPYKGWGFKQEPFIFGDSFGFTIYRDSLSKDVVLYIFEFCKELVGVDFDFHISDGYYETNDVGLSGTQYFRGYCIDILSTLHKKETIEDLNRLRKELKIPNK